MKKCKMSVRRVIVMAAAVFLIPNWLWAQDAGDQTKQPMIAKIKDLIADFDESQWTVVMESGSVYGDAIGGVDRAKKTATKGYFNSGRQFVEDDSVQRDVIEIDSPPMEGEQVQEIRGAYTNDPSFAVQTYSIGNRM